MLMVLRFEKHYQQDLRLFFCGSVRHFAMHIWGAQSSRGTTRDNASVPRNLASTKTARLPTPPGPLKLRSFGD